MIHLSWSLLVLLFISYHFSGRDFGLFYGDLYVHIFLLNLWRNYPKLFFFMIFTFVCSFVWSLTFCWWWLVLNKLPVLLVEWRSDPHYYVHVLCIVCVQGCVQICPWRRKVRVNPTNWVNDDIIEEENLLSRMIILPEPWPDNSRSKGKYQTSQKSQPSWCFYIYFFIFRIITIDCV